MHISDKYLGNSFDINPKWTITLPLGMLKVKILIEPTPHISKLTFDTLLWACGAESHTGT
jgi:hypothetical protein